MFHVISNTRKHLNTVCICIWLCMCGVCVFVCACMHACMCVQGECVNVFPSRKCVVGALNSHLHLGLGITLWLTVEM